MKTWTLPALKAYVLDVIRINDEKYDQRFRATGETFRVRLEALEKSVVTSFAAAQRAEDKADAAQVKKNESMNEMRGLAEDFNKNAMPRSEAMMSNDRMLERITRQEDLSKGMMNRGDVTLLFDQLEKRIVQAELLTKEGKTRDTGIKMGWAAAVAVVGLVVLIAGFLIAFLR